MLRRLVSVRLPPPALLLSGGEVRTLQYLHDASIASVNTREERGGLPCTWYK